MFCSNCGREISEGSAFCSNCGSALKPDVKTDEIPVSAQPVPPAKAKAKNNKLVPIIIGIAAFVVGSGVIAPMIAESFQQDSDDYGYSDEDYDDDFSFDDDEYVTQGDSDDAYSQDDSTYSDENYSSSSGSEYERIFSSNSIIDSPALFLGLNTAEFVIQQDGGIEKIAYGYNGDLIKYETHTVYVSLFGATDEDKAKVINQVQAKGSQLDALDFCTVTYNETSDYFIMTTEFSNLDNTNNIKTLCDMGFFDVSYSQDAILSMKYTENTLLSQGYAKK